MKKVYAYVLSLGVLLVIMSGMIFAAEAETAIANGTTSSLSVATDVTSSQKSSDVYGPNDPEEPGGLHGPGELSTPGKPGSNKDSGGFSDYQYPLILLLGVVVVMVFIM